MRRGSPGRPNQSRRNSQHRQQLRGALLGYTSIEERNRAPASTNSATSGTSSPTTQNARLLRWLTDADTARMVDLFLEVQNEEAGDLPDLFIRFDVPFEDGRRHGFSLLTSFRKQYEEIRAGIAEERIPADWTCPDGRAGESDIVAFGRACISFRRYYDELMALT